MRLFTQNLLVCNVKVRARACAQYLPEQRRENRKMARGAFLLLFVA
jgi:hypothetical protein